jgi:hypothetical protein
MGSLLEQKRRQAMSIMIRFIILMICAYAGSSVAREQFSELPAASYELAQK